MSERALVLAGAGATGNAWEIGVVAGLYESLVDVTNADVVIGTSAGSTAAAQITGDRSPTDLLASVLEPAPTSMRMPAPAGPAPSPMPPAPTPARPAPTPMPPGRGGRGGPPIGPAADHMDRTSEIISASTDAADMRRRLGAAALATDPETHVERQAQWRATAAARLGGLTWPKQRLLITAVDAETGEPVVFDRDSGVDLVDAVAASTSNGFGVPPYRIGDRRFINGGYRRSENADLAVGCQRVLILSPFSGRSRYPAVWRMDLVSQIDDLEQAGSEVATIFPYPSDTHLFGENAMDLSLRRPAAKAGYEQGRKLGERLREFWGQAKNSSTGGVRPSGDDD